MEDSPDGCMQQDTPSNNDEPLERIVNGGSRMGASSSVMSQDVLKDEPSQTGFENNGPNKDQEIRKRNNNNNNNNKKQWSQAWSQTIRDHIHGPILRALHPLAKAVVHHPRSTLVAVVSVSLLLFGVGLATNFHLVVEEEDLWTPFDSLPRKNGHWIEHHSNFPKDYLPFAMFFHSDGQDVLGLQQVHKVFEAVDAVRDLDRYQDMCADSLHVDLTTNETTCPISGIVQFWNSNYTTLQQQVSTDEEVIKAMSAPSFPDGIPVSYDFVFGNTERTNNGFTALNLLTFCQGYLVVIGFPDTKLAESFEDEALEVILSMQKEWEQDPDNSLRLEIWADGSFADEFERGIVEDIPLVPLVFVVMTIFTSTIMCFGQDKFQWRCMVGFGGVVAVLLSLFSGYGLLFCIGVPFTSVTQLVTFVIFGIGLDDAIIIFGSYCRTDSKESIETRIAKVIDDVGISITLTSLTSSLAFGLGAISSIPAVYWLCLYSFPSVIFVYLYQITFFVACIVLHDHRVRARELNNYTEPVTSHGSMVVIGDNTALQEQHELKGNRGPFDRLMIRYAKILLKPAVRTGVIVAFVALVVAGAISASKLVQHFEITEILPHDSYATAWFNAYDAYAQNNIIKAYVYFRDVDQSNETIQNEMQNYVNDLVEMEYVGSRPKFNWLRDFKLFVKLSPENVTKLPFNEQLDLFLSNPIYNYLYKYHIVRDREGNVTTSRVELVYDNFDLNDVQEQIGLVLDQRDITARQPINRGVKDWKFFNYEEHFYLGEFFYRTRQELVLTSIIGVTSVSALAIMFIPHWTAGCFVLSVICLLYVDLLGVLQWANVNINAVTYIAIVMAIGLYVDYIMHVLLRYYECKGNRKEKTVEMLRTMGSSVLAGGISTFLGIMPLALSTSSIFYTLFIAFLGLVVLGIAHGLILMPALLATVGPSDEIANEKHATQTDGVSDHTGDTSSNNENDKSHTDDGQKEESLSSHVMPETLDFEDIMKGKQNGEHQSNDDPGILIAPSLISSSYYENNHCEPEDVKKQKFLSLSVASETVDLKDTLKDERSDVKESCDFEGSTQRAACTANTLSSDDENGHCETQAIQQMLGTSEGVDPDGAVCVNESNEAPRSTDSYAVSFEASASVSNEEHDPREPQAMKHVESAPLSDALAVIPMMAVNAERNDVQQSNDSFHKNEIENSEAEAVYQEESIQPPTTSRSKETIDLAEGSLSWDENRRYHIAGMQELNSLPLPVVTSGEAEDNGQNFLINQTNDLTSPHAGDDQAEIVFVEESLDDEPI